MERLTVPQGDFNLARYPERKEDTLRAWDAADEYVLRHLAGEGEGDSRDLGDDRSGDQGFDRGAADMVAGPGTGSRGTVGPRAVLVVNDTSGALATALAAGDGSPCASRVASYGDSYVAAAAARANLARNRRAGEVAFIPSLGELPGDIGLVVVKIPRNLALLEAQLRRIAAVLPDETPVVGAAMAKNVHTSTIDLFDRIIGPTHTSRAAKKARLLLSTSDRGRSPGPSGWPKRFVVTGGNAAAVGVDDVGGPEDPGPGGAGTIVVSHAGVFSAERLDVGTRFFLESLPVRSGAEHVVDLGCGNGVVGTISARSNRFADVTFVDDSYLAVASADATFRANLGPDRDARFVVGNGMLDLAEGEPIAPGSVDLVLNNPPFHIDQAVGDAIAWQMFSDARAVLARGGELWVVGNRHLAYHAKLKRLFGNCAVRAANSKFVVLCATRT